MLSSQRGLQRRRRLLGAIGDVLFSLRHDATLSSATNALTLTQNHSMTAKNIFDSVVDVTAVQAVRARNFAVTGEGEPGASGKAILSVNCQ
jgi:uncharacterized protein (DUF2461 family)